MCVFSWGPPTKWMPLYAEWWRKKALSVKIITGKLAFKWKVAGVEEFSCFRILKHVSLIPPFYLTSHLLKIMLLYSTWKNVWPHSVTSWVNLHFGRYWANFVVLGIGQVGHCPLWLVSYHKCSRSRKWSEIFIMFCVGMWRMQETLKVWLELPLISYCISSKGAVLFLLSGLGEPEGPGLKTQRRRASSRKWEEV